MQLRSIRKLATLAGMAGLATLILTAPTRADLTVTVQQTGMPAVGPTVLAVGSPTDNGGTGISSPPFTGTFGNFSITNGSVGESQGFGLSQAFSTALNIINTDSVSHTLTITLVASKFTAPVPTAGVLSSFTGTTTSGTGSGSLTSMVGATTLATQTVNPFGTSFANSLTGTANGLSAPFSITQTVVLTLTAGENINFTARTQLAAVPEPGTIAMALTALPLLGLGALARRRRARA
jgi:hypothetical protein